MFKNRNKKSEGSDNSFSSDMKQDKPVAEQEKSKEDAMNKETQKKSFNFQFPNERKLNITEENKETKTSFPQEKNSENLDNLKKSKLL